MVGHANTEPKFSKSRRLGKNKKKSWRGVDISKIEEFLDDERFQLRTTGLLSEKTNEELFLVDKTKSATDSSLENEISSKRIKRNKQLRCYASLVNTSKITCPRVDDWSTVKKKLSPSAIAALERKANSSAAVQAFQQREQALREKEKILVKNRNLPEFNADLWTDEKDDADEFYLQVTKKRRVKTPTRPALTILPAVEPPHPGASYNPSYEDHQDLLLKAHLVEGKKEKEERRIINALDAKFPTIAEAPSEATWLQEMSAGLFDEEDADEEETQIKTDVHCISLNPPVEREDAKTRRQKRKARESVEMKQQLLMEKKRKLRENMVYSIYSLRSQIHKKAREQEKRAKLKSKKREAKKAGTKKLGKEKYVAPDLELKLSDELVGSLRQLKPEGHLLVDRYKSLQKRNIIEPRKTAKKIKTKKKIFEKKSHRNIS